jgi:uncharacterized protein
MLVRLFGVVLVVGIAIWFLRRLRNSAPQPQSKSEPASIQKLDIAPCEHCGVHLPRQELLPARNGALFCSEAHRALHEDQP